MRCSTDWSCFGVVLNMTNDKITITFSLSGRSECGDKDKPESCLDCSDLHECVMNTFYDAVSNLKI